jgi:hypothetical protein
LLCLAFLLALFHPQFFLQGDRERADGMPVSALFDRETTNVNLTQTNFICYVIAPLAIELLSLFPTSLAVLGENLVANNRMWFDKYADGDAPADVEALREHVETVEEMITVVSAEE